MRQPQRLPKVGRLSAALLASVAPARRWSILSGFGKLLLSVALSIARPSVGADQSGSESMPLRLRRRLSVGRRLWLAQAGQRWTPSGWSMRQRLPVAFGCGLRPPPAGAGRRPHRMIGLSMRLQPLVAVGRSWRWSRSVGWSKLVRPSLMGMVAVSEPLFGERQADTAGWAADVPKQRRTAVVRRSVAAGGRIGWWLPVGLDGARTREWARFGRDRLKRMRLRRLAVAVAAEPTAMGWPSGRVRGALVQPVVVR